MQLNKRFLIFIGLFVVFVLALIGILKNTSWAIGGINRDSTLEVSTSFPNADCTKILKSQFPFVEFHCTEKAVDEPAEVNAKEAEAPVKEKAGQASPNPVNNP